jgi:hypothetical protein
VLHKTETKDGRGDYYTAVLPPKEYKRRKKAKAQQKVSRKINRA